MNSGSSADDLSHQGTLLLITYIKITNTKLLKMARVFQFTTTLTNRCNCRRKEAARSPTRLLDVVSTAAVVTAGCWRRGQSIAFSSLPVDHQLTSASVMRAPTISYYYIAHNDNISTITTSFYLMSASTNYVPDLLRKYRPPSKIMGMNVKPVWTETPSCASTVYVVWSYHTNYCVGIVLHEILKARAPAGTDKGTLTQWRI